MLCSISMQCSQGTHVVLQNDQKAKATVGGIIDATGSLGI